jgi:mRNA interferase MazF
MKRGEFWAVDLDPVKGHDQARRDPGLILSADAFNTSPAELMVVLPLTSKLRRLPSRVRIVPPEDGLRTESCVICEQVRMVSMSRLSSRLGTVSPTTMRAVSDIVHLLLKL